MCSRCRPGVAQRVGRGIALLSMTTALPGRTLPQRKIRYTFYRRLGGPQGRSRRAENLVPTGIPSRFIEPAVSRYTD